jgi:hypothetical protein
MCMCQLTFLRVTLAEFHSWRRLHSGRRLDTGLLFEMAILVSAQIQLIINVLLLGSNRLCLAKVSLICLQSNFLVV